LAAEDEGRGDLDAAIERTRRLVALDPLSEEHARALIGRLAAAGDRAAAMAAFASHREQLRTELRMAPSAATRALADEIRGGVETDEPSVGVTRPPLPGALALAAAAAVLAAAVVAWLVWVMSFHGSPQVTSQIVGYQVRGQHTVAATFTVVRRDPGVRASCLLRAVAADHAVVGELAVAVTSGPATQRVRSTVRTERAATSVELLGCSTKGRPGLR
jgi:hypothetical protein